MATQVDYYNRMFKVACERLDALEDFRNDSQSSCGGGTIRTASLSEIMDHRDSDDDFPHQITHGAERTKDNSFLVLNASGAQQHANDDDDKELASLRCHISELRVELKRVEDELHQTHLKRETFELEREIVIDEAKAKLSELEAEASKQREKLAKAKEHLGKVLEKQDKIREQNEVLVVEMNNMMQASQHLLSQSHDITKKTREVEANLHEFGIRLGLTAKDSDDENEAKNLSQAGIQFVERRGLLKALRVKTRQVLPKKPFVPGAHSASKSSQAHLLAEAEKENAALRAKIIRAEEDLRILKQKGAESSRSQ